MLFLSLAQPMAGSLVRLFVMSHSARSTNVNLNYIAQLSAQLELSACWLVNLAYTVKYFVVHADLQRREKKVQEQFRSQFSIFLRFHADEFEELHIWKASLNNTERYFTAGYVWKLFLKMFEFILCFRQQLCKSVYEFFNIH